MLSPWHVSTWYALAEVDSLILLFVFLALVAVTDAS